MDNHVNKRIKRLKILLGFQVVLFTLLCSFIAIVSIRINPDNLKRYLENTYTGDFSVGQIASAPGWIAGRSVSPLAQNLSFNAGIKWQLKYSVLPVMVYTDNYYDVIKERIVKKISSEYVLELRKKNKIAHEYRDGVLTYICDSGQLLEVTGNIMEIMTRINTTLQNKGFNVNPHAIDVTLDVYMGGEYRKMSFNEIDHGKIRDKLMSEFIKYHTVAFIMDQYELKIDSDRDVEKTADEVYQIMQVVQKELKSFMLNFSDNLCEIDLDIDIKGTEKRVHFTYYDKSDIRDNLKNALFDNYRPPVVFYG